MRLISRSPDDTEEVGFRLGRLLKAGDVVGMFGDLGSGKTTMIKGIARALGIDKREITSASFTIIAEYHAGCPFYHTDLYRIEKDEDIDNTGIWDCIRDDSITVIEWAEKLKETLPAKAIKVNINDTCNDTREISIEGIHEEDWNNL